MKHGADGFSLERQGRRDLFPGGRSQGWRGACSAGAFVACTLFMLGLSGGYGMPSGLLRTRPTLWLGAVGSSFYLSHPVVMATAEPAMHGLGIVDVAGPWSQILFVVLAPIPSPVTTTDVQPIPTASQAAMTDIGDDTAGRPTAEAARPVGAGPSLAQRAARGGIYVLGSKFAAQIILWSLTFLVARLLSPADYGVMTIGMVLITFADLIGEFGLGKAIVFRDEATVQDLSQCYSLTLLIALGLYAAIFVAAPLLADHFAIADLTAFLRMSAIVLLLTPLRSVSSSLLERRLEIGRQSLVVMSSALFQSVVVVTLAHLDYGYWALAAGMVAGRVLETALYFAAAPWRVRFTWPSRAYAGTFLYGYHSMAATALWFFYSNSDFAVVGLLLGATTLGVYSLAFQIMSMPVQKLSASLNQLVFAVFCRLRDDGARLKNWYLRLTALILAIGAPSLAGLALIADDGLPLILGEQWRPAVLPFQLLCPVGMFMMVSAPLHQLFSAIGRPDISLKTNLAFVVVCPISFVALGYVYGLVGICLAWLVIYPVIILAVVHINRALSGISVTDLSRALGPVAGGVLFMVLVVLGARLLLDHTAPVAGQTRLAIEILSGAVSYTLWIAAMCRRTILADLLNLRRLIASPAAGPA